MPKEIELAKYRELIDQESRGTTTDSKSALGKTPSPTDLIFDDAGLTLQSELHIEELSKKIQMSEIDAKIAASEARTDTKFAEMMGELRLINSRMEHVEKSVNEVKNFVSGLKQTIITTAIVTAIGVIGVVVAIFGYGTSMFATGMDAQTIADKATQSAIQSLRPDIEELQKSRERQEQQYDLILKAIQAQANSRPQ